MFSQQQLSTHQETNIKKCLLSDLKLDVDFYLRLNHARNVNLKFFQKAILSRGKSNEQSHNSSYDVMMNSHTICYKMNSFRTIRWLVSCGMVSNMADEKNRFLSLIGMEKLNRVVLLC